MTCVRGKSVYRLQQSQSHILNSSPDEGCYQNLIRWRRRNDRRGWDERESWASNHHFNHHYYNLMLFQLGPLLDMILFSFVSPSCFSILLPFFLSLLHSLTSFFTAASFRPLSPRFHFRCPPTPASYVIWRQQCLSLSLSFSLSCSHNKSTQHIIIPTLLVFIPLWPDHWQFILTDLQ